MLTLDLSSFYIMRYRSDERPEVYRIIGAVHEVLQFIRELVAIRFECVADACNVKLQIISSTHTFFYPTFPKSKRHPHAGRVLKSRALGSAGAGDFFLVVAFVRSPRKLSHFIT